MVNSLSDLLKKKRVFDSTMFLWFNFVHVHQIQFFFHKYTFMFIFGSTFTLTNLQFSCFFIPNLLKLFSNHLLVTKAQKFNVWALPSQTILPIEWLFLLVLFLTVLTRWWSTSIMKLYTFRTDVYRRPILYQLKVSQTCYAVLFECYYVGVYCRCVCCALPQPT